MKTKKRKRERPIPSVHPREYLTGDSKVFNGKRYYYYASTIGRANALRASKMLRNAESGPSLVKIVKGTTSSMDYSLPVYHLFVGSIYYDFMEPEYR